MRRAARVRVLAFGALAVAALASSSDGRAETPIPPPPTTWVTDRASFLSADTAADLNQRLASYAAQTGHQVLVYVDHTTGGVPIEDWAVRAFERWKVGRSGLDDGVVLFIFSDDHALRIEVGYGVDDRLPDALTGRIVRDQMVPRIRAGDRDGAVRAGADAVLAALGSTAVTGAHGQHERPPLWQLVLGGVLLVLFVAFMVTHPALAAMMLLNIGSGRRGMGGGFSGGGGFGGGGGGGFSGGGGRSGGGGASGSW